MWTYILSDYQAWLQRKPRHATYISADSGKETCGDWAAADIVL